jgi:hypothetical protein
MNRKEKIVTNWDNTKSKGFEKIGNEKDRKVLEAMLQKNPELRMSADKILEKFGDWLQYSTKENQSAI